MRALGFEEHKEILVRAKQVSWERHIHYGETQGK